MVEIYQICPPIKLSGRTSFILSFSYNEQLWDIMTTIDGAVYHKTKKIWEVPETSLAQLLDLMTFYTDMKLHLVKEESDELLAPLTEEEISSFKYRPYQHQVDAINYGLTKKEKWLLLDSMGLGKSLEMMYLAETLYRRGKIEHCLIICGVDSLRTNWKTEISKFSNLSAMILGEYTTKTGKIRYKTIAERAEQLKNPIEEFFIIVNIATIRDKRIVEAFLKSKNKIGMICFDEAHRATKSSQQGENLLKLKSRYQVAATGTPIVNNPISAFLALSWTDNDNATLTNFKRQYCKFGGFNNSQVIGYRNLNLLKEELDGCSIRRTFDQVRGDMPTKTIEYEIIEMDADHRDFYEAIKDGIKEEADKITLNSSNLLALTTRLRQATAAPSLLTTQEITSSKIDRAVELAEDLLDSGEKVVIFSTFVEPCKILKNRLSKYNPLLGTGEQSPEEVERSINQLFRETKDYNLLIGTHGKIGTGFSMPECHYEIIIDQPWTYSTFSQTVDRCYRITSEQPIFVKVLVCKETIDERVQDIVENKRELADYLIDGKENAISESMREELFNIIKSL